MGRAFHAGEGGFKMVARTTTDLSAVSRRGGVPCRCQNFTVTCMQLPLSNMLPAVRDLVREGVRLDW
jgi:hypothetical protein